MELFHWELEDGLLARQHLRVAEVGDFRDICLAEEHVFGADVAMDAELRVEVVNPAGHLNGHVNLFPKRDATAAAFSEVEQQTPVSQTLRDDVHRFLDGRDSVQLDHVAMEEPVRHVRLLHHVSLAVELWGQPPNVNWELYLPVEPRPVPNIVAPTAAESLSQNQRGAIDLCHLARQVDHRLRTHVGQFADQEVAGTAIVTDQFLHRVEHFLLVGQSNVHTYNQISLFTSQALKLIQFHM